MPHCNKNKFRFKHSQAFLGTSTPLNRVGSFLLEQSKPQPPFPIPRFPISYRRPRKHPEPSRSARWAARGAIYLAHHPEASRAGVVVAVRSIRGRAGKDVGCGRGSGLGPFRASPPRAAGEEEPPGGGESWPGPGLQSGRGRPRVGRPGGAPLGLEGRRGSPGCCTLAVQSAGAPCSRAGGVLGKPREDVEKSLAAKRRSARPFPLPARGPCKRDAVGVPGLPGG